MCVCVFYFRTKVFENWLLVCMLISYNQAANMTAEFWNFFVSY